MKQCSNCGQFCEDAVKFCNNCGQAFPQEAAGPVSETPVYETSRPIDYVPRAANKKEFLKLPENKPIRSEINAAAIVCYVLAGLNLAVGIYADTVLISLLDVAILVGLGLGIHLAKSRVCAIILLVYAVAGVILGLVINGKITGYLIVMVGIFAVIYTFKAEKAWQQYRQGGVQ